jgi:hypothetical protein
MVFYYMLTDQTYMLHLFIIHIQGIYIPSLISSRIDWLQNDTSTINYQQNLEAQHSEQTTKDWYKILISQYH